MEENSPLAQAQIFEVIENQLRDNNPPEVAQTFDRLRAEGNSKEEAMKLIGCAVSVEIFEVLQHQKPFDHQRYVSNLNKLPRLPWDDQ